MMCRNGIVHSQVRNFVKRASVSRFLKRMLLKKHLIQMQLLISSPKLKSPRIPLIMMCMTSKKNCIDHISKIRNTPSEAVCFLQAVRLTLVWYAFICISTIKSQDASNESD